MDNKELLTKIIKQQTRLSQDLNLPKETIEREVQKQPSEKALKIKSILEKSGFDDDDRGSLGEISSVLLGEEIVIESEESDDDSETLLEVNVLALLVADRDSDDARSEDISKNDRLLIVGLDIENHYGDHWNKNEIPFPDRVFLGALDKTGVLSHCFQKSELYTRNFRFATETEIEMFVEKFPENAISFWFESVLATAKFCNFI